ncbi:MAG: TIGR03936 family radical SAM-associated protein [Oscillospiraceae bacterium]|nr:TIGR03936 family radical SAM-associated protein [Oscillospiraceae bacterium]
MYRIRCLYSKKDKAAYISHLDFMSTIQRSLIRAGVKLIYTKGFNPHPYISIALPLSVGVESECELLDVEITGNSLPKNINNFMPDGVEIHRTYISARKLSNIQWVDVFIEFIYDFRDDEKAKYSKKLLKLFSADSLIIDKKSKSGIKSTDIAPFIKDVNFSCEENIIMTAKLSAQNPTIGYNDIIQVFNQNNDIQTPDLIKMKRIAIYDKDMILFK